MHYTPESIKEALVLFVKVGQGVASFLPGEKAQTVKNILGVLSVVVNQDWFLELLAYLMNTFNAQEPTKDQLSQALHFFAVEKQATGMGPATMKVPGQD